MNPADLVSRRAYVRVYSGALGCENLIMAEGRVMWYQDAPTLGVQDATGRQHAWSTRLRIEEVPEPALRWTPATEDLLGAIRQAHEATFKRYGQSWHWQCPLPCGADGAHQDYEAMRLEAVTHERRAILAGLADAGLLVELERP